MIRSGGLPIEPRPFSEPVAVRGVEGNAFSTGAGWTVIWPESGTVYNLGGGLLDAVRAVAIAEMLQPVDEATLRQHLAGAGSAAAPQSP